MVIAKLLSQASKIIYIYCERSYFSEQEYIYFIGIEIIIIASA